VVPGQPAEPPPSSSGHTDEEAAAVGEDDPALYTVGHGTASEDELVVVLRGAQVRSVVDVRRFPGSRRHPHVARDELERWLPEADIAYRWEERLGGRRRGVEGSQHTGLRDPSFRAYADHLGTEEFAAAIAAVLVEADQHPVAIMCSESVWWRCHRRLIADHVVLLAERAVRHLFHDGRLAAHQPTDVARVEAGRLVYDAGAPTLDLGS
jgi:uncharacterized protein (DUF488 family)